MTSLALLLAASVAAPPATPEPDLADCGSCHQQQQQQWEQSLHARSMTDPLYIAMREWARSDGGEKVASTCESCHSVGVFGTARRTESVTCAACHQAFPSAPGPAGWTVVEFAPVLAAEVSEDAPHRVVATDGMRSSGVCMACHAELHNPHGVPLCTTGPESERAEGGGDCTACHMPSESHRFPGTTPELLREAATLAVSTLGREVEVMVTNSGAAHALPTGSALRQIRLEVVFMDGAGTEVARHTQVFARVLEDAQGNAPAPPWRARAVHRDTRLQYEERRSFRYTVAEGSASVSARLVYHRAPEAVARRLGVADHDFMAPVEMVAIDRQLDGAS